MDYIIVVLEEVHWFMEKVLNSGEINPLSQGTLSQKY
jgi:hypothetical protein